MIKFARDNLEVCIETEPVGDGVKFFITIPAEEHGDIVKAIQSAGFEVDDYEILHQNVRFTFVVIRSYEDAQGKYSIFVNLLRRDGFKIVKQGKKRYSQDEVFAMFN